jgi:hypothetical protein
MGRPLDPDVVSWLTNRRRLGGVVAGVVVAVAVAHFALKDQVLSAIARLAGGSWSAAVVMGWVVYAVPAAIAVAYLVLVRNRLSVAARRAALVVLGLLFVPAVSLGPGRFSGFDAVFRDAPAEVARIAHPLRDGLTAGLFSGLAAGLLALWILVRAAPGSWPRRSPSRSARWGWR